MTSKRIWDDAAERRKWEDGTKAERSAWENWLGRNRADSGSSTNDLRESAIMYLRPSWFEWPMAWLSELYASGSFARAGVALSSDGLTELAELAYRGAAFRRDLYARRDKTADWSGVAVAALAAAGVIAGVLAAWNLPVVWALFLVSAMFADFFVWSIGMVLVIFLFQEGPLCWVLSGWPLVTGLAAGALVLTAPFPSRAASVSPARASTSARSR